jgi:hypothetical protein
VTDWEPATETEAALRDALRANDQELYFRVLGRAELWLPVSADALSGRAPMGWGTWTTGGRTHLLAFTSADALHACLADNATSARRMRFPELAGNWPNVEWWLAVNPGLPIEGYLPAWFVSQLARGDVRLPGRTMAARARVERAESAARARATAAVPTRATQTDPLTIPPRPALPPTRPVSPATPVPPDQSASPAASGSRIAGISPVLGNSRVAPPSGAAPVSPAASGSAPAARPESPPLANRTAPAAAASAASAPAESPPPAPGVQGEVSGRGAVPDSSSVPAARTAPVSAATVGAPSPGPRRDEPAAPSRVGESAGPGRGARSGLPTRPRANGPVGVARVSSGPVGVAPVSGAPAGAAPVSAAPTAAPVSGAPTHPAPVSGAPAGAAPVSAAPAAAPVSGAPAAVAPVSGAPGAAAPAEHRAAGVAAVPRDQANGGSPAGAIGDARLDDMAALPGEGRQTVASGAERVVVEDAQQVDEPATDAPATAAARAQVPETAISDGSRGGGRTAQRNPSLAPAGEQARQAAAPASAPGEAFTPANATEEDLFTAARDGSTDSFLSTLLLARVLLPVSAVSGPGAKPGDDDFVWRTQERDDETYVVVFTSPGRLADHFAQPVETVDVKFVQLIRYWPDEAWSFAVNPGTPVGAKLPGAQIIALASWAAEVGLVGDADAGEAEERSTADEAAPGPTPESARQEPARPTMMQKTVLPAHAAYYLDRGYDRVSGFVHRAQEVAHLSTPSKLRVALGLGYAGTPFASDMDEVYVLRWPAHQPSLYRIPYGGQTEAAMRAMEGWVIERPPFRGNGFAPGDSTDVVAEFKVDSLRLPHGAQLWRIAKDGSQQLVATLDSDGPTWRRSEAG